MLLDGRFSPITDQGGFVEASAEELADWYVYWSPENAEYEKRHVSGSLSEALRQLCPLWTFGKRVLFLPTRSTWTAAFDDRVGGTDPGFLGVAAQHLNTRTIRFACKPDRGVIFELYEGGAGAGVWRSQEDLHALGAELLRMIERGETGRTVRAVAAILDGDRWSFDVVGEPLWFEDEATFRKRRIRDRFPPALLRDYLEHMGIRAFDDAFYVPDDRAVMVERIRPQWPGDRPVSLERARKKR